MRVRLCLCWVHYVESLEIRGHTQCEQLLIIAAAAVVVGKRKEQSRQNEAGLMKGLKDFGPSGSDPIFSNCRSYKDFCVLVGKSAPENSVVELDRCYNYNTGPQNTTHSIEITPCMDWR